MDIGSGRGWPESALSNFAIHPFALDGILVLTQSEFVSRLHKLRNEADNV